MYLNQIITDATATGRSVEAQQAGSLERIFAIAQEEAKRIETLTGTDVLDELVVDIFSAVDAVGKMLKGDLTTGLLAFAALITKYKNYQPILSEVIAQIKDLDAGEARELFATLKEEFDIEDDELEEKIENIIEIPVNVYEKVGAIATLYEEIAEILQDEDLDGWAKLEKITDFNTEIIAQIRDIIRLVKESVDAVKALFEGGEE